MKKVLFVLLALAMVTGGVFAQVAADGLVQSTFGLSMDLGRDKDDDAGIPERDSSNSWMFGLNDAKIGVTVDADVVTAGVRLQAAGGGAVLDWADASVNLDPVTLSIGFAYLPWVQWSSLAFDGDSNWGFGASAVKDTYIQAKFGMDDLSIYAGLARQGVGGADLKDNAVFPGFYIGGDYGADAFSVGAAFLGAPRGKFWDASPFAPGDEETRFFWMGNLHFKLFFDPLTVGVNVALYGDPEADASDTLAINYIYPVHYWGGNEDSVLEALLDIGVGLDPCDIGFTVGFLSNMADTDKGGGMSALKIGLSATFDLGGGFSLIPGLKFTKPFGKYYDAGADKEFDIKEKGQFDIGLTFCYGF